MGDSVNRGRRRIIDPAQFDLFEPHHERREDGHGPYIQFLIAPPSELSEPSAPGAAGTDAAATIADQE